MRGICNRGVRNGEKARRVLINDANGLHGLQKDGTEPQLVPSSERPGLPSYPALSHVKSTLCAFGIALNEGENAVRISDIYVFWRRTSNDEEQSHCLKSYFQLHFEKSESS